MFEICARERMYWNEYTCANAASEGQSRLKHAHEKGCPLELEGLLLVLPYRGHRVFEILHENGVLEVRICASSFKRRANPRVKKERKKEERETNLPNFSTNIHTCFSLFLHFFSFMSPPSHFLCSTNPNPREKNTRTKKNPHR